MLYRLFALCEDSDLFCITQYYKGRYMKFAIVLAGCGQHDGSETHEVILTLLSLAQEKIEWDAFAPDIPQRQVINHITEQPQEGEKRQVLIESARLVRGKIKPITEADISSYDAIIFPGGFGAVSNLCNWGEKGKDFSLNNEVVNFLDQAISNKKPLGFICIAPMIIPRLFKGAKLTIGNDEELAKQISSMGSTHITCEASDVVVDKEHKIVSTPANMVANSIYEVYIGIHKLVKELSCMS